MARTWCNQETPAVNRRELLRTSAAGFASVALAGLLQPGEGQANPTESASGLMNPLAPRLPHFAPTARRVIFLFMHGGPSQVDTFDYKPLLERDHGKPLPFAKPRVVSSAPARLPQQWGKAGAVESDLTARIESFELAYRMQMAAPEAIALETESEATQKLYGLDNKSCTHFARQCLIARRLVERGTRFVQIYSGGMDNELSWDGHSDIRKNHSGFAQETDQPIAGLLADLESRGLLESTLVIWGGEFGRLPIVQKGGTGRDHNPHAFTYWMAGGGIKPGVHHGATDEIGHKAVEKPVSVHDLHATILHLLGLEHTQLTYRFSGRDFRLTDVSGEVVDSIIA